MEYRSHFTFATLFSILYAIAGIYFFSLSPEHAFLTSVVIIIAGMLPDIDAGNEPPARELGGLVAAVFPVAMIELFPSLKESGISRIALVVVCGYLLVRVIVIRGLQKFTARRGIIHSIPAAILTFEVAYLLFWDLPRGIRLFVATGAFLGFFTHLLIDAWGNFDLVKTAMGKAEKKEPVLKFFGKNAFATVGVYCSMLILGWFVVKDVYPNLQIFAGVRY